MLLLLRLPGACAPDRLRAQLLLLLRLIGAPAPDVACLRAALLRFTGLN